MCGIALTLITPTNQPDPTTDTTATTATVTGTTSTHHELTTSSAASSVASSFSHHLLAHWSSIAESGLRRRGPDSQASIEILLTKKANVNSITTTSPECVASSPIPTPTTYAILTGAVLHLRGDSANHVTRQPLCDEKSGNILCWNGEVYSINQTKLIPVDHFPQPFPLIQPHENDTAYILSLISRLPSASFVSSFTRLMSAIDGPFSFIFYHAATNTIWFGRDKMGRRSLVTGRRKSTNSESCYDIIHISSLILHDPNELADDSIVWEEVATTGLWCIDCNPPVASSSSASSSSSSLNASASYRLHHSPYPHVQASLPPLSSPVITSHLQLPLACSFACGVEVSESVAPYVRHVEQASTPENLLRIEIAARDLQLPSPLSTLTPAGQLLYSALHASMAKRIGLLCTPSSTEHARVGILFSGGIDCMVLALFAHRLLPITEPIDLINVAFCGELQKSSINKYVPDRITSINGWKELNRVSSNEAKATSSSSSSSSSSPVTRRWNLIHVNVSLLMLEQYRAHILSLLQPNCTVMDFNIASVLWFGTMAKGILYQEPTAPTTEMDASSPSPSPDSNDIGLIQSRLSRLGKESSSDGSVASAPKKKQKGRVLPPELLEKLLARQQPPAAEPIPPNPQPPSDSTPPNGPSHSISDSSAVINSSSSPNDTDATLDEESADSPFSSLALDDDSTSQTKSARRSSKNRERKLIRSYFKKLDRKAHDEELDEILPSIHDFPKDGEEQEPDVEYEDLKAETVVAPTSTSFSAALSTTSASSPFYTSHAKILLIGIGADEQLAGYGRHRTVYAREGATGLAKELAKDFDRIWRRNLGRDDRIISDSGREARHPFLDEDLVELIHSLPIEQICDFSLPPGLGDKRILRQLAGVLGLESASKLVKRAMQFGSRIANKKVAGYVSMDSSIRLREIVNPFFLRPPSTMSKPSAEVVSTSQSNPLSHPSPALSTSPSAVYDTDRPQPRLDKKKQRQQGKPGFD